MREISSPQNPLVKHLSKLRTDAAYRHNQGTVLIEGEILINEICREFPALKILTINKNLPTQAKANDIYFTNPSIMKKISGLESPEGLIAEIQMPSESDLKGLNYIAAFDKISDPGNMGTLLRTGLALGWQGAFILEGSCDPFNDKALRASKGALFRLPYRCGNWNELNQLIQENKLTPFGADIVGTTLNKVKPQNNILLVLGNEAKGLSDDAKSVCERVTIPMPGEMESLNVAIAGAILMYNLRHT